MVSAPGYLGLFFGNKISASPIPIPLLGDFNDSIDDKRGAALVRSSSRLPREFIKFRFWRGADVTKNTLAV
jgi:hypothetical protein